MPRLTSLFAATTLTAAIVSVLLWQQLRTERLLTAKLQERVSQLELAQGRAAARAAMTPGIPAATSPQSGSALRGEAPAAAEVRPGNAAPVRNIGVASISMRELLKDPDFRDAQAAQLRASLSQNYPDLARELGLSPEEADAMLDLLAKRTLDSMANSLEIGGNGQPPDEAALRESQRLAQESQRKQEADLRALLGPDKYQKWQDYQQSMPARQQVNQLRTTLSTGGQPLSDEQAKSLVAVVSSEQKRRTQELSHLAPPSTDPDGRADWMEENLRRTDESNHRILAAAASYLDSRQLTAYERVLNQQLAMTRAFQRAQRAQTGAGGASTTVVSGPVVVTPF